MPGIWTRIEEIRKNGRRYFRFTLPTDSAPIFERTQLILNLKRKKPVIAMRMIALKGKENRIKHQLKASAVPTYAKAKVAAWDAARPVKPKTPKGRKEMPL